MVHVEKAQQVEDIISDVFDINEWCGYVYLTIHLPTGRQYIGKKNFFNTKKVKLGKKELASLPITRGKKPTTKQVITESDWKTYYGSAKEIKEYNKSDLRRYILRFCKTKKELTYWEVAYQFKYDVLLNDTYINDNILGKFYRKDFDTAE